MNILRGKQFDCERTLANSNAIALLGTCTWWEFSLCSSLHHGRPPTFTAEQWTSLHIWHKTVCFVCDVVLWNTTHRRGHGLSPTVPCFEPFTAWRGLVIVGGGGGCSAVEPGLWLFVANCRSLWHAKWFILYCWVMTCVLWCQQC